ALRPLNALDQLHLDSTTAREQEAALCKFAGASRDSPMQGHRAGVGRRDAQRPHFATRSQLMAFPTGIGRTLTWIASCCRWRCVRGRIPSESTESLRCREPKMMGILHGRVERI